jgi:hypothetical protein
MVVLFKDDTSNAEPKLLAYALDSGNGLSNKVPKLLWSLSLKDITRTNNNGVPATFVNFAQDHAIFAHEGIVYVPSSDFDGMLLVDVAAATAAAVSAVLDPDEASLVITDGQWDDSHRLCGSVAGIGNSGKEAIFAVHGSNYGIQSYNKTGQHDVGAVRFNAYSNEFSHPVSVTFSSYTYGTVNCVIASEYDPSGGIFISAVDSETLQPCGFDDGVSGLSPWSTLGYYISDPSFSLPSWVSAPAVLYNGYSDITLIYAVNMPNGDRRSRRCSIVSIAVVRTGPFSRPTDTFTIPALCNAAPLVIRNAYGFGNHAIAVGASDGQLYIFRAYKYSANGPLLIHDLSTPLPPPVAPGTTNDNLGIAGNYLAASSGGTVAMILYNTDAQEYWFAMVAGAMYSLPTDPTPSPTQFAQPSASPSPSAFTPTEKKEIDAAAAVFGTLAGIGVLAAGIVYFAPTAGFTIGGSHIVPADSIKSAAAATWNGATWLVGKVTSSTGSYVSPAITSTSSSATAPILIASGERTSLLK